MYCFVSSATLLFQWCLTGRNWANMGETEQICTQWYRVPKVWTMPFWAGSSAQSSSRVQDKRKNLYSAVLHSYYQKKLRWENIWKVYKQSNRNSKWSFIPMRVLYHIQSIIHWWFLPFSLSRLRLPSPLFWRFLLHPSSYYLVISPSPLT